MYFQVAIWAGGYHLPIQLPIGDSAAPAYGCAIHGQQGMYVCMHLYLYVSSIHILYLIILIGEFLWVL